MSGIASGLVGYVPFVPANPWVLAHGNSGQSNVTGNATQHIVLMTEYVDRGGNFASNTFTAPVTGAYQVCAQVELENGGCTQTSCNLLTSNRAWQSYSGTSVDPENWAYKRVATLDMDTGDTLVVKIQGTGVGSDTSDINGGGTADNRTNVTIWFLG